MAVDLVRVERLLTQGNTFVARDPIQLTRTQLSELNSLPTGSAARNAWLRARGAVDPVDTHIKLILRGNRKHKVRITDMTANAVCEAPLSGTLFYDPPGGEDSSVPLIFNLDEPEPKAKVWKDDGTMEEYFARKSISLKRDEDIPILVMAQTLKHDCKFSLQLEILTDSGTVRQVIDDNGHPFEVSALIRERGQDGLEADVTRYRKLYVSGIADTIGNGSNWHPIMDPKKWRREFEEK